MKHNNFPTALRMIATFAVALPFLVPLQSSAQVLEEVIVTAQKRSENLQEVPVSVSTLAGSEVEMFRFRDSTDISAQIPNLQATNTAGGGDVRG